MAEILLEEPLSDDGLAYLDGLHAFLDRIGNEQGFVDPDIEEPEPQPALRALSFPVETGYQSPNFYTPEQVKARWGLSRTFTEITVHHWGSTGQRFDSVAAWLCNKDSQVSAHYVVGDGRVARLVSEGNVAWTNGSRAGNATAITIECRPEASDEDYRLVAELIKDIRSRRGDLPVRPHRVWTSTTCPGRWDLIRLDRLARAGSVWACTKVMWRGAIQCAHSIPKLDLLALTTPNDFLVTLIQGAFSTGTSASAGTHAGGGAFDHKGSGYSWTQMGVAETAGRRVWFMLFRRRYIAGLWSQHGHGLDPECPRLSKEAQAQFYLFEKGYDALVGNNADTGYRGTAAEIMRLFRNRLTVTPSPTPVTGDDLDMVTRDTARDLFTKYEILVDVLADNPSTAPRVAPSRLIEGAAALARSAARDAAEGEAAAKEAAATASRVEKDLADLNRKVDGLASGGITEEMLEAVLRRLYGSLDGVVAPPQG